MISLGLRYFLEVARSGSIAAAAGAQHVAASAVSRQIAKLEDELGIALFERQARGMALSDAGRQLAAYASAAALEAERVATEIRHRGEQGDVTVRLACTEGFAHRFLPQCMAEFKRLRPQARFHLRVERPEEVGRLLLEGLSQIGLRYTTVHDDRLSTEVLCRAPVYAVMCRRHALAGRRSVSVRDLARLPLSLGDQGTTVRQLFDAACANAGLHIEPAYVSNHSAAFLPMLAGSDIVAPVRLPDRRRPARRAASGRRAIQQSGNAPAQRAGADAAGRTLPGLAREFMDLLGERLEQGLRAREGEAPPPSARRKMAGIVLSLGDAAAHGASMPRQRRRTSLNSRALCTLTIERPRARNARGRHFNEPPSVAQALLCAALAFILESPCVFHLCSSAALPGWR